MCHSAFAILLCHNYCLSSQSYFVPEYDPMSPFGQGIKEASICTGVPLFLCQHNVMQPGDCFSAPIISSCFVYIYQKMSNHNFKGFFSLN